MRARAYSMFSRVISLARRGAAVTDTVTTCAECDRLRAQLRRVLEERDSALLSLARERERANAILLSQVALGPLPPGPPPPKPMRYWAVDLLNSGIKKALPLPHAGVR